MHRAWFSKNTNIREPQQRVSFTIFFYRIEQISGNIAKHSFVWQKTEHQMWTTNEGNDERTQLLSLRTFVHITFTQPQVLVRSLLCGQASLMNVNQSTVVFLDCSSVWELTQDDHHCVCGSVRCGFTCLWQKLNIPRARTSVSPNPFTLPSLSPSGFFHLPDPPSPQVSIQMDSVPLTT